MCACVLYYFLLVDKAVVDCELVCFSGQLPFNIRKWDQLLESIEFELFDFKLESSITFNKTLIATGVVSRSVSVSHRLESFNYLLLDPRELDHFKPSQGIHNNFRVFIQSVFYVGKGTGERPKEHLKKAKKVSRKSLKFECTQVTCYSPGRRRTLLTK